MVRVAQESSPFGAQCRELQDDTSSVASTALPAQSPAHGLLPEGEPGGVGARSGQNRRDRDVGDTSGVHGLSGQGGETHLERVDAGIDLLEGVGLRLVQTDTVAFELLDGQADETGGLGVNDCAVGVARLLTIGRGSDEVVECLEALIET